MEDFVFLDYLERFRSLPERFEGDKELSDEMLHIEFRDVWFRYPGSEKYSLEAVNVMQTADNPETPAQKSSCTLHPNIGQ